MATEKTNGTAPAEQAVIADEVQATPTPQPSQSAEAETQTDSAARQDESVDEASEPVVENVDFSDEEARLAAESPEFDLGDEAEGESEAEAAEGVVELEGKSKEELVELFGSLLASRPVQSLRRDAESIKVAFYKLHRAEVERLRREYLEGGGEAESFALPADGSEARLKSLFADYRRKRDEFLAGQEAVKEDNLRRKLAIIEELKELVDSNETLNHTFTLFRALQQKWKETGPVPQANVKDVWETYNLHVENFYNFIKINKELRDLDLKRNYEAKVALCEEAEALALEPSVVAAFHKLQKLHEEWRETGPVANEFKESLWERFREASTRVNKQHQTYFENVKEEQKRNLELKSELCVKAEELTAGEPSSRKEWSKASEQLLEIQKVWKSIGFAPKKDNARIYERFRNACDRFFEQKREYYLRLKGEMDENLRLKNEICEQAEALQESTEWKRATDELISLQRRWKEIGPVARRHSDAVWKRFRAACDRFFNRKSEHFAGVDSEHEQNLLKKRALLEEMAAADIAAGGFEAIKEFQRRWSEIGFVPIKQKESLQAEYKAAVDKLFAVVRGGERDRSMDRFRSRVSQLKSSGERKLRSERDRLYAKVKQLENDIAVLENNIGFFSSSRNAESMISDIREKIAAARSEMAATIEKINIIDRQE